MPGRKFTSTTNYRYGFNGKEEDDEVKGDGNQQDYGMRIYDTRLSKFLSVDPLVKEYPELTPYQFAGNRPIEATDLDGAEPDPYRTMVFWKGVGNSLLRGGANLLSRAINNPNYSGYGNGVQPVTGKPPTLSEFKSYEFNWSQQLDPTWQIQNFSTNLVYGTSNFVGGIIDGDGERTAQAVPLLLNSVGLFAGLRGFNTTKLPSLHLGNKVNQRLGLSFNSKIETTSLGEWNNAQASNVFNAVNDGSLPGSQGAYLGGSRLNNSQMENLTKRHGIEFAQVYTIGTGKNGGGGFYTLYSGTKNSVNVPVSPQSFLINHSHPGGTPTPSIFDIQFLLKSKAAGSPQNSSIILPVNKPPVRFNTKTPPNGNE